jgi:protoporphyrinogen/coproporphyrinogen III oxidase
VTKNIRKNVCIVGGGISGLVTAYLVESRGYTVTLFEASFEVGGNIRTKKEDGYLLEDGPNSLLRSPRLVELIDSLGLRRDVLPTSPSAKKRFVVLGGQLQALPTGIGSLVFGGFFSAKAKLRLMKEPFVRSSSQTDESVAEFFERRLGPEVVSKAVDPFISGIFAGDPARLSIREAFPKLYDLEGSHGSLLRGSIFGKREAVDRTFPRSFTFQNGLTTFTDRLRDRIGEGVCLGIAVTDVSRESGSYRVTLADGSSTMFDAVVISTKAGEAAEIIERSDGELAQILREVYYPPMTVVRSAYLTATMGSSTEGFGFLVPRREGRRILGSLWTSSVFPGRAPEGESLFTTFIGGARAPELFELSDEESLNIVHTELSELLNIRERPVFTSLTRWKRAIPQYNIGYGETVDAIERFTRSNPGTYFCSNFYGGISVGDCVKNAYRAADSIAAYIDGK